VGLVSRTPGCINKSFKLLNEELLPKQVAACASGSQDTEQTTAPNFKKKVRSRNKCEPTIGHANNYVRNCKDLGLETTSNSCLQCRLFKASFSGATWSWRPRFRPPDRLFGYITILPGPQIYYWADLSCKNCINLRAGRPRASAGTCS
jgi:hypothetical protein